jgi:hypothetical protein
VGMRRSVPRLRRLPAALAVASLALAGCGTAGRENDAARVAESFYAALEKGDGSAACALLNEEAATKLEHDEGESCDQAILKLGLPMGGPAEATRVYVTSAWVRLADAGITFLDEGPDGWKVSAAGCQPTSPDRPYDCELEA